MLHAHLALIKHQQIVCLVHKGNLFKMEHVFQFAIQDFYLITQEHANVILN